MISFNDWKKYFPYSEPRAQQTFAIDFILNAFINEKKKYTLCELGTGIGKSAIGLTVARFLTEYAPRLAPVEHFKDGAHILTTQKVLQDQYMRDFGPPTGQLTLIKSSTNYDCEYHRSTTCAESRRVVKVEPKGTPFWRKCTLDCHYIREKQAYIDAQIGTTNYSYFLAETMYGGKIPPRQLLVLDECHSLQDSFSKFVEMTVIARVAENDLKLKWPSITTSQQAIDWLTTTYEPKLALHVAHQEATIVRLDLKEKIKEFKYVLCGAF